MKRRRRHGLNAYFSRLAAALACKRCGGSCFCHTGVQILGVPCPPTCEHYGDHFDGCHYCDCTRPAPAAPPRVELIRQADGTYAPEGSSQ